MWKVSSGDQGPRGYAVVVPLGMTAWLGWMGFAGLTGCSGVMSLDWWCRFECGGRLVMPPGLLTRSAGAGPWRWYASALRAYHFAEGLFIQE